MTDRTAKAEKTGKAGRNRPIPEWERDEIRSVLALTDGIRETARITGRSHQSVARIYKEDYDQIVLRRAEMSTEIGKSFDATIWQVQATIRFFAQRLMASRDPEDVLSRVAKPLFDLGKLVAIETERRQVLADLPGTIARQESSASEEQREADKRYAASILRETMAQNPAMIKLLEGLAADE